jgi:predicted RNA-binding protein Jag
MKKTRSPLYVTSLIAGAFFMENLDGTVIATALPQMARSFHIGAVNLNIGMTAYLLTLAVFIPISGWVADRFGSRTIFAAAVVIFTLASLLCGVSHTLTQFTLTRILQGMGGAMMVPVGRLIVLRTTPKDQLTQAIAYITWPGLTALVLGPPLGGFITTYASWRWIFFLNLPLGILAFLLTLYWVDNVRTDERHPFDWLTFLLAGFASTGAVYAMEKLGGGTVRWQLPAAATPPPCRSCGIFTSRSCWWRCLRWPRPSTALAFRQTREPRPAVTACRSLKSMPPERFDGGPARSLLTEALLQCDTVAMPIDDYAAAAARIAAFLKTLTTTGGLKLKYRITAGAGAADPEGFEAREIYVELAGPDAPLLTQRGGELLYALEHVAAKVIRLEPEEHDKVSFDAAQFKAIRAREMRLAAETAASEVRETGEPYSFQPMSSRERRMLHLALKGFDDLETASSGENPRRFVVVYLKGTKPPEERIAERQPEQRRPFGRGPSDRFSRRG